MKNKNQTKIEERFNVDKNRLYGNLNDTIKYLQEIKEKYSGIDIRLDEHWTGYEDMDMTFVYNRDETREETLTRLEIEEQNQRYAREQRKREETRKADLAELKRLREKLGIYY